MISKQKNIGELFNKNVKEPRSPLYVAMSENYEAIKQSLENGRPDWQSLIAGFAKLGIMDGDGKIPTLRGAQNTWYRVKQARSSVRAARPDEIAPLAPQPDTVLASSPPRPGGMPPVMPVARPTPAFDPAESADEPPTQRFQFGGPATLRGHTPAPPPSKPQTPKVTPVVQDVAEVVARLLGRPHGKPQSE